MRCRPIVWPRPTAGLRISCTWHLVSNRVHVAFPACVSTRAPRRWRPSRCLPFHVPIPPATSTNCPVASDGRGGDSLVIPRPVVQGPDGHCASLVLLPMPSPGHFGCGTARYVDGPQAAMGSRHRPGTAPGPAGEHPPFPFAPPLAIQLRS